MSRRNLAHHPHSTAIAGTISHEAWNPKFLFAEPNSSAQHVSEDHLVESEPRPAERDKKQRRSLRLRRDERAQRDAQRAAALSSQM